MDKNKKAFRWTIGVIGIVCLIAMILIFVNSEEVNSDGTLSEGMKISSFVGWLVTIIVFFGTIWFVTERFILKEAQELSDEPKKLKKPVTIAERKKFVEHILFQEYANYTIDWIGEKTWEKGKGIKSLIHAFIVGTYYKDRNNNLSKYLIVINCHDPESKRNIVPIEDRLSLDEIWEKAELFAESLADFPEESQKTRVATHTDLTSGKTTTITEPVEEKKEQKKEETEEKAEQ